MRGVEYLRYSSSSQTEQSIEGQRDDCDRYAAAHNIEIVERYIDRAERGGKETRESFQRMIADAKKGKFDVVLVWKYDRFYREEYHSLMYENKLADYGVKLVSVLEPVPEGAVGTVTKGMLRVIAQFYTDDLREKVERGMRKTAEKGNYPGGSLPLGYKSAGGKKERKIVIDEETAPLAKKAFEMYADGKSKTEIAHVLTLMGGRSRSGGDFQPRSLSRMFTNEKYIGVYSYDGKYRQEGAIPALIDRETWDRAQARAVAAHAAPATSKARVNYLLSMKLYCGYCGALMAGESGTSKSGDVHYYYKCSTRKRFGTCHKETVRKGEIEQLVARTVKAQLTDEFIAELSAEVVRQARSETAGRGRLQIEAGIREQEKRIQNLTGAIAAAGYSEAILAALKAAEEEKKRLGQELAFDEAIKKATRSVEAVVAFLMKFRGGDLEDPKYLRALFDVFVQKVVLWDDRIRIFLSTAEEPVEIPAEALCSDFGASGAPNIANTNPVALVFFLCGTFGICVARGSRW